MQLWAFGSAAGELGPLAAQLVRTVNSFGEPSKKGCLTLQIFVHLLFGTYETLCRGGLTWTVKGYAF